jgi:hypothetical protein
LFYFSSYVSYDRSTSSGNSSTFVFAILSSLIPSLLSNITYGYLVNLLRNARYLVLSPVGIGFASRDFSNSRKSIVNLKLLV